MSHISGFPPIENPNAHTLILGSMPGVESLRVGQYYAHPRNAFWPVMGELVGAYPVLPYAERIQILKSAGIALWDVLASCHRPGSLDANIETASLVPNDFKEFFSSHPLIRHVYFNGAMAEKCFIQQVAPLLEPGSRQYQRLPSTSPAHAALSFQQKLQAWQIIITPPIKAC